MFVSITKGTSQTAIVMGACTIACIASLVVEAKPVDKLGELSRTELLAELRTKDLSTDQVASLLARAENKDQPDAIAGRFSVRQLLEALVLGSSSHRHCTDEQYERRRKICSELEAEDDNLFAFCESRSFHLDNWCRMNSRALFDDCLSDISQFNRDTAMKFANEVRHLIGANAKSTSETSIRLALETKESWFKVTLKATCTRLNQELAKRRHFLHADLIDANLVAKSCKLIELLA